MDFNKLDNRIIYLLVLLALSIPLITNYQVEPAQTNSFDKFFSSLEQYQVQPKEFAFVAIDFGPNGMAENYGQSYVVIEHLMRKRIPIIFFSVYYQAEVFLEKLPKEVANKLMSEYPEQEWKYGKDWIDLGYRPGAMLLMQMVSKSDNVAELFKKDSHGNYIKNMPVFRDLKTIEQIKFLAEFTSLAGVFDYYLQFFKRGNYTPIFLHGCTSITIPDAYAYLDSGQIAGLLGGISGAAWYSTQLSKIYTNRDEGTVQQINTGLGVAHLVIIFLIVLGNLGMLLATSKKL